MVVIALAICLLSAFFMIPVCAISIYSKPSNVKTNCLMLGAVVFIIAYAFEFKGTPDIYRYIKQIEEVSYLRLNDALNYDNQGTFVYMFMAWIAGKLDMPKLIPAITAATVYAISTYISGDYAVKIGREKHLYKIIILQLLVLPMFQIASNVRNVFSFSLIILAMYQDIINKKRNIGVIALYILPCFIHNAAFVIVALRLIAIISQKALIIVTVLAVFGAQIINYIYLRVFPRITFGGYVGTVLRVALDRSYHYINGIDTSLYSSAVQASTYHQVTRIVTFICATILIYISYKYIKASQKEKNSNLFPTIVFLLCIATVASNIFAAPNYWRFFAAANICMGTVLLPIFPEKMFLSNKSLPVFLFGLSALALSFLHAYGNLVFVDYTGTLMNMVFVNIYTIFFGLLKNITGI